jgi:chromosome segregation ATPase
MTEQTNNLAKSPDLDTPDIAQRIRDAAMEMLSQGKAPTVTGVRTLLGSGSFTTITKHVAIFLKESHVLLTPATQMPDSLAHAMKDLWMLSLRESDTRFQLERERAEAKLADLQGQYEGLQAAHLQLKGYHEAILDQYQDAVRDIGTTNARLADEQSRSSSLQSELNSSTSYIEMIREEHAQQMEQAANQISALEASHAKDIEQLTDSHSQRMKQESERNQNAENALLQRISNLELEKDKAIAKHQLQIKDLADVVSLSKEKISALEALLAKAQSDEARLLVQHDAALARLQSQIEGQSRVEAELRAAAESQRLITETILARLSSQVAPSSELSQA